MRDWRPAVRPQHSSLHVRRRMVSRVTSGAPQPTSRRGSSRPVRSSACSRWISRPGLRFSSRSLPISASCFSAPSRRYGPEEAPPADQAAEASIVVDQWRIKEAAFAACFGLTRAEREILPLLAHRLTDQEIARRRFTSPRTVSNQTASILGKLHLTSRREIARVAAQHGLEFPPIHSQAPE